MCGYIPQKYTSAFMSHDLLTVAGGATAAGAEEGDIMSDSVKSAGSRTYTYSYVHAYIHTFE